ncbi:MAG TPA: cytochrome c [Chiayiivirga sp.]|nr:cytochrome c [Chiayiivirga sp.]
MTHRAALLAIALTFSLSAGAADVGDIEAGKAKSVVCQACHGADGNGIGDPQYPLLAGQYADYLAKALHDYKSGARDNAIMKGFASTLSDQDMLDLAAFFSGQTTKLRDLQGIH